MPTFSLPRVLPLVLMAGLSAQDPDFRTPWLGAVTGWSQTARQPWAADAADLDGDGDLDLAIANGPNVPALTLLFNQGGGRFGAPQTYKSAPGSFWQELYDVATGDFDRDGDMDVVLPFAGNTGSGTGIIVHRNNGNGTLAPYQTYVTGKGPTGVAVADINADGWPDVATADYGRLGQGNKVSILLNDTQGGFRAPINLTVPAAPKRIEAGDMDGDGRPDLVVGHDGQRVTVLLNPGGEMVIRSFATQTAPNVSAGLDLVDMDGDGDLDVLFAESVLYNDGSGALGGETVLARPAYVSRSGSITGADFNGDGAVDVVTTHIFNGEWAYHENDGNGGFKPPVVMRAGEYVLFADTFDADGDGRQDLLLLANNSLVASIYLNRGRGLAPPKTELLSAGFLPHADGLAVTDINVDGYFDIATAVREGSPSSGGPIVLFNQGGGVFGPPVQVPSPTGAIALKVADINRDGRFDLIWGDDRAPHQFHTAISLGSGGFGPVQNWSAGACSIGDIEALDLDGDKDMDVVVAVKSYTPSCGSFFSVPLYICKNDGNGNFAAPTTVNLSGVVTDLTSADLDGDGNWDLIANSAAQGLEVLLSNGDGTFAPLRTVITDPGPTSVVAADFDGDGIVDLAVATDPTYPPLTLSVAKGLGNGLFQVPAKSYEGAYDLQAMFEPRLAAGDVDSDGDIDLMMTDDPSRDVALWRNRGDGTFEPNIRYGLGAIAEEVAVADITGDGIRDLITIVVNEKTTFGSTLDALVSPGTGGGNWVDLGFGLAGTGGVPQLASLTPFAAGTVGVSVSSARAGAAGAWILGVTSVYAKLFGGTLVPQPDLVLPMVTNGNGAVPFQFTLPQLAPGAVLYLQAWVVDPAGPQGLAGSNALRGIIL